ncbi:uncharacterized protein [Diadema antillarum]|uniref:uncharacterized protein n=1 Tax=Diadema antillarum TaxID=105358 RepID=UPI003A83A398
MKGRREGKFRRYSSGKVPSLAFSANICYMSMDRQTESFVCLGLIVILLQNTGRSQAECSKRYTDAPGLITNSLPTPSPNTARSPPGHTTTCRYRIFAPPDHYILLNITQLEGVSYRNCLPRLVVKDVGVGNSSPLATLCNGEEPLPLLVQSRDNELRVVFRSQVRQTSLFRATFTFHKKLDSPPCLACPLEQTLAKSMNASHTLPPPSLSIPVDEHPEGKITTFASLPSYSLVEWYVAQNLWICMLGVWFKPSLGVA